MTLPALPYLTISQTLLWFSIIQKRIVVLPGIVAFLLGLENFINAKGLSLGWKIISDRKFYLISDIEQLFILNLKGVENSSATMQFAKLLCQGCVEWVMGLVWAGGQTWDGVVIWRRFCFLFISHSSVAHLSGFGFRTVICILFPSSSSGNPLLPKVCSHSFLCRVSAYPPIPLPSSP